VRVHLKREVLDTNRVLPKSVSKEVFRYILARMGIPEDRLNKISITIRFVNMIPPGGMYVRNDSHFEIYLRENLLDNYSNMQKTVAHELKHVAVEILRPKKHRTDGKKKGPYKWEEVNCTRAEKRWGGFEYIRRT